MPRGDGVPTTLFQSSHAQSFPGYCSDKKGRYLGGPFSSACKGGWVFGSAHNAESGNRRKVFFIYFCFFRPKAADLLNHQTHRQDHYSSSMLAGGFVEMS